MKIIVGLGNPGSKYEHNRHNAGFLAIDRTIADLGFKIEDLKLNSKFNALLLEVNSEHSDAIRRFGSLILAIPQTFMNLSGEAVKAIGNFYKVDYAKDLLVIHDDVDLPFGEIRATPSASAAGHNGIQNIIDELGTQDFNRIRIGVENRPDKKLPPTEAFVLQNFSDEELEKLHTDVFPKVKLEIEKFIQN